MSDARAEVLERVRAALAGVAGKHPLPDYAPAVVRSRRLPGDPSDRPGLFATRLRAAGGESFDDPALLGAWLRARGATHGYVEPTVATPLGAALGTGVTFETRFDRNRLDAYQFGITRAAGAIAETGSLILTDALLPSRLGALAPWIHVAVVESADIHDDVASALDVLGDDPYVLWCTGPSKTADVEGILIEGVHGPGEQVALIFP